MRSLCLYASYVDGIGLPYYSSIYLEELKKHFQEVIYLHTNTLDKQAEDFFDKNSIKHIKVINEGFDFGQWKKIVMTLSLENYDQLCLVNDSCVLFSPLNKVIQWFNQSHIDFGGLTQSQYNNKHLQSYFLIFNKSTFSDLKSFFDSTPISTNIYQVIKDFEIGLSQYLISKNYTYDAFLNNDGYNGEYAPYYQCVKTHINQGSPMIKKKILFSSYRKEELFTLARMNFDINVNTYIDLIKKNNPSLIISFDQLLKLESNKLGFIQRVKFNLTRLLIQLYRKIK